MAFGMETYNSNGTIKYVSPDTVSGRIFVDLISKTPDATSGTQTHYTYAAVSSHTSLILYNIGKLSHDATLSTVSGDAVVTLTSKPPYDGGGPPEPTSNFLVFTKQVTEPSYGIETLNSAGETILSTEYPVPEFLGTISPPSTPTYDFDIRESGYREYIHNVSSSLGSGRNRIVLWDLATNTDDCWVYCDSLIPSSYTGSTQYSVSVIRPTSSTITVPTGYIFALDGHSPSSDTYGARVFDSSGNVVFDTGKKHLNLVTVANTMQFPTVTGTTTSTTLATGFSVTNAIFMLGYFEKETWVWQSVNRSRNNIYRAATRRDGSVLYGKLFHISNTTEDYGVPSATYTWGDATLITQIFADADDYV